MPLTDLNLKTRYHLDNSDDIIKEFYRPALAQSVKYDRTTYNFTPRALAAAGRGLESFLLADGHIRLICDQKLEPSVYQAIQDGLKQAQDVLLEVAPPETLIESSDLTTEEQKRALELLTWLVAQGRIDIKIAFVPEDHLFHEKEGILTDAEGNRIAFSTSANETGAAWLENYERTTVFTDWQEPHRVNDAQEDFDLLWENRSRRAIVTPASETHIQRAQEDSSKPPAGANRSAPTSRKCSQILDIR